MTNAALGAANETVVDWQTATNLGELAPANFTVPDGGISATNVSSAGAKAILIEWDSDVDTQPTLTYTGSIPGLLSPQTIAINP